MCERCKKDVALPRERYCKACRKAVLAELRENGYLTPRPYQQSFRSQVTGPKGKHQGNQVRD